MVLTKSELIAALQNEVRILLHLAGKMLSVRARSTREYWAPHGRSLLNRSASSTHTGFSIWNDLIWWIPFGLYLHDAWRWLPGSR